MSNLVGLGTECHRTPPSANTLISVSFEAMFISTSSFTWNHEDVVHQNPHKILLAVLWC